MHGHYGKQINGLKDQPGEILRNAEQNHKNEECVHFPVKYMEPRSRSRRTKVREVKGHGGKQTGERH